MARENEVARPMPLTDRHRAHWRKNVGITLTLLAIWFVFSFVTSWFAPQLNAIDFIGPLGFYLAAQGSLIVYVLIVWFYAHYMDRLDRRYGVQEDEEER